MRLLYDSTARLAEVLGLSVSDVSIDRDNPQIRVNGKGSKSRVVPISLKTAAHLAQYISAYYGTGQPDTHLLFCTVIKKEIGMISEANVERFIRQFARKARSFCSSIPDRVHHHVPRNTGNQLYQNGVSQPLVSRLLGHASLRTTRLYAQPSLKLLRDTIESIETSKGKAMRPPDKKLSGLR